MKAFLFIVLIFIGGMVIVNQFHKKEGPNLAQVKSWGYQLQGREEHRHWI